MRLTIYLVLVLEGCVYEINHILSFIVQEGCVYEINHILDNFKTWQSLMLNHNFTGTETTD